MTYETSLATENYSGTTLLLQVSGAQNGIPVLLMLICPQKNDKIRALFYELSGLFQNEFVPKALAKKARVDAFGALLEKKLAKLCKDCCGILAVCDEAYVIVLGDAQAAILQSFLGKERFVGLEDGICMIEDGLEIRLKGYAEEKEFAGRLVVKE